MEDLDEKINALEEMRRSNNERLRIFSVNVDELPDGGAGFLRKRKLDWTVLMLPGGRQSSACKAYATRDPVFILVNGQCHTLLYPVPHGAWASWQHRNRLQLEH